MAALWPTGRHEWPAALAASPFARVLELVLDGLASPHSRRSYALALARFLDWYEAANRPRLSKATV